jgi:hypothetical protein
LSYPVAEPSSGVTPTTLPRRASRDAPGRTAVGPGVAATSRRADHRPPMAPGSVLLRGDLTQQARVCSRWRGRPASGFAASGEHVGSGEDDRAVNSAHLGLRYEIAEVPDPVAADGPRQTLDSLDAIPRPASLFDIRESTAFEYRTERPGSASRAPYRGDGRRASLLIPSRHARSALDVVEQALGGHRADALR